MMSKKDYETIATVILSLVDNENNIDRDDLVERLSERFKRDNPDFNADIFRGSCYSSFPTTPHPPH